MTTTQVILLSPRPDDRNGRYSVYRFAHDGRSYGVSRLAIFADRDEAERRARELATEFECEIVRRDGR